MGKVTNSTFNKLRNYALSRHLNNNIKRWDGTVGMEYFNSPNNWYRWTETPEIEGIREMDMDLMVQALYNRYFQKHLKNRFRLYMDIWIMIQLLH